MKIEFAIYIYSHHDISHTKCHIQEWTPKVSFKFCLEIAASQQCNLYRNYTIIPMTPVQQELVCMSELYQT